MAALSLSFLIKLFPICFAPFFWRWISVGNRPIGPVEKIGQMLHPRRLVSPLIFVGIATVAYLPYANAGGNLISGLSTYAEHWELNSPVYDLLAVLGSKLTVRILLGVLFVLAVVAATLTRVPPLQAGFFLTGLFLWLSPTLHPWYFVWLLPFLAFYRSWPWLVLTGLALFSYVVLMRYEFEGVWEPSGWVEALELGGFLLVWAGFQVWRWSREGRFR